MTLTRRGLLAGTTAFGANALPLVGLNAAEAPHDLTVEIVDGKLQLRPDGPETPVTRYAGTEPFLVAHARQGQETVIRLRNGSRMPTSFRLCGIRGQGSLDDPGTASGLAVPAGAEAVVRFDPPDGGTAWFRPRLDRADQAAHAPAGVLIVDSADAPAVDEDLVCFLRDWTLDDRNRIASSQAVGSATVITVNDTPLPSVRPIQPGARLRMRLVNGSIDRVMVVAFEGASPSIVAIDGQPSELFLPVRGTVPIGPGARFDTMLDMPRAAGQVVRLMLRGTERVDGTLEQDRILAILRTEGAVLAPKLPIGPLPRNPALPSIIPLERSKRAELTIDLAGAGWTMNGVSGTDLPKVPMLRVRQGDVVTLGFINASRELVPLSLYGQAVRLLHAKDDGWEPYWRDTVLLPPGSRNHVAFMADKPGRWLIESGFAAQALAGLRCWFEVLRA